MNEYSQLFSSVVVIVLITFPSDNKLIVINSGLNPSWLLLSFHVFLPEISVVAGVCVFVMLYPPIEVL